MLAYEVCWCSGGGEYGERDGGVTVSTTIYRGSVLIIGVLILLAGFVGCLQQTRILSNEQVVRARRFEIVDKKGNVRGAIGADEGDGASYFVLKDREGRNRVQIIVEPSGLAAVALRDEQDRQAIALTLDPDRIAALAAWDRQNNERASLGLAPNGQPSLTLSDEENKERAGLALADDGTPFLTLGNEEEQKQVSLRVPQKQAPPELEFLDRRRRWLQFMPSKDAPVRAVLPEKLAVPK